MPLLETYAPCGFHAFDSDEFIYELKVDGCRALAHIPGRASCLADENLRHFSSWVHFIHVFHGLALIKTKGLCAATALLSAFVVSAGHVDFNPVRRAGCPLPGAARAGGPTNLLDPW